MYEAGSAGNDTQYIRYSAVDGHVTTDANGSISAWKVDFTLYDDGNGGGITLHKEDTQPPTIVGGFPFAQDSMLSISSDPIGPMTITGDKFLNGKPYSPNFNFNATDMAFEDRGSLLFKFYTEQPGSFTSTIPEPETWAMMMVGLGLLGWQTRRRKN